jgi:signal transduction histidine kinase
MNIAEPIISVRDLVKKYDRAKEPSVDGVSFDVGRGEFFAFLGPNGAGKTTTISILTTTLSATSGIELPLDLEPVTITADEALLDQVWSNLLHNAVKFTPPLGSINIKSYTIDGDAVCDISDSDAGIAEADLPHIFERFYKTDKARDRSLGGNGLGLALAKKVVEIHGGNIAVTSEYGKGSVFTVRLPIRR